MRHAGLALVMLACGNKSDTKGAAPDPATGMAVPAGDSKPEGCSPPSQLISIGGDLGFKPCQTVADRGDDGCLEFPLRFAGLDVELRDPLRTEQGPTRTSMSIELIREHVTAGAEYQFSKTDTYYVHVIKPGVEQEVIGVDLTWDATRDGKYIYAGVNGDGWTTGTVRVKSVATKRCEPYVLDLDLELHHPTLPSLKVKGPLEVR